jgi:hypothetical protein
MCEIEASSNIESTGELEIPEVKEELKEIYLLMTH